MAKMKKRKYKKWFVYTVFGVLVFLALFILLKTVPVFVVMEGDRKMTIEVHSEFTDPGAVSRFGKKPITPKGSVDTHTLGKYTLKYSSFLQSFTRTVRVVDTTAPEMTLNGRQYVLLPVNGVYQEAGVTVTDNYDGDISSAVKISGKVDVTKPGMYQVIYTSTDSSKNESTIIRMVNVQEDDFSYVGNVTDDAGISDGMKDKIISLYNAYYRSLKYLEPIDTSELFHSDYPENAARFTKGLELTVARRRNSRNDLTLDDCHYDLTISSTSVSETGAIEVVVLEDGYYNFHFLGSTQSRQHGIETDFYFRREGDEYKITSVNHIEGAFIYVDNKFDYSDDYQKALDEIGEQYMEAYTSTHQGYEQDRQAVIAGSADTSGIRKATNTYNRERAVSYAKQYATVRNLQYPYYGSNCMNFVSQCMHAGGIPYDYTGNAQWKNYQGYYDDSDAERGFSYAFIHIYYFQNYLGAIEDGMVVDQNLNLYLGEPGDFIYVDSNTDDYGEMGHVILISDVIRNEAGEITDYLVCGNTNDQYCYPLSAQASIYKKLAKVEGYN